MCSELLYDGIAAELLKKLQLEVSLTENKFPAILAIHSNSNKHVTQCDVRLPWCQEQDTALATISFHVIVGVVAVGHVV